MARHHRTTTHEFSSHPLCPPALSHLQENVYLLLAQLQALLPLSTSSSSSGRLSALFISNKIRACPVWGQRAGGEADEEEEGEGEADEEDEEGEEEEEGDGSPVLWDYHGTFVPDRVEVVEGRERRSHSWYVVCVTSSFRNLNELTLSFPPSLPPSLPPLL